MKELDRHFFQTAKTSQLTIGQIACLIFKRNFCGKGGKGYGSLTDCVLYR